MDQTDSNDDQVMIPSNYLSVHAINVFYKRFKQTNKNKNRPRYWTDNSCVKAKLEFKKARNELNNNNSDENRKLFIKAKNRYNNTRKRARKKFIKNEAMKLEKIAKTDPRNFWKSIRKIKTSNKTNSDDITLNDFYVYFKNLFENEEIAQCDCNSSNPINLDPGSR